MTNEFPEFPIPPLLSFCFPLFDTTIYLFFSLDTLSSSSFVPPLPPSSPSGRAFIQRSGDKLSYDQRLHSGGGLQFVGKGVGWREGGGRLQFFNQLAVEHCNAMRAARQLSLYSSHCTVYNHNFIHILVFSPLLLCSRKSRGLF